MKRFHSHGKLLLTGEYVVLDGAISLAVPTKFGQNLVVTTTDNSKLVWKSYDSQNKLWFQTEIKLTTKNNLKYSPILLSKADKDPISERLIQILNTAQKLNPSFLTHATGYSVETHLEFPKHWGLGTSSTLINNIANWAEINAFELLEQTFGGSGYDIACAEAQHSLIYQLQKKNSANARLAQNNNDRLIQHVNFNPSFKQHLYFVYLNQKQDSREGIAQYRQNTSDISEVISRISDITNNIISCESLQAFKDLIDEHEMLISEIINQTPVKQRLFTDFKGSIKSLGAWGGDFILVASDHNPTAYFSSKGYQTILYFSDMVKQ